MRRLLPLVVVFGLAGLAWGLLSLHQIFLRERDEALAGLAGQRASLAHYANKAVEQRLRQRLALAEPTFTVALADPLQPAEGLYAEDAGQQLLPRTVQPLASSSPTAAALYAELTNWKPGGVKADGEDPWERRRALWGQLKQATNRRDAGRVERSLREILEHRSHFVLATRNDFTLLVAMAEHLHAETRVPPAVLRGLLRDGLDDGRGIQVEGLQRALLSRRNKLSAEDFGFLSERVVTLSRITDLQYSDFEARKQELAAPPLKLPRIEAASIIDGRWYLEPRADGSTRGLAVVLDDQLADVAMEMRERGLLDADARITAVQQGLVRIAELAIDLPMQRWGTVEQSAQRRYKVKSALLAATAMLALGMLGLAGVAHRRKLRFVELKSDFVATVSHELRTPLASIRLLTETLERKVREPQEARDYLSRILREVDGLAQLVENLLSFNRIDKGRWQPQLSEVRVAEVISTVERELAETTPRPLVIDSRVDDTVLLGDAQLIRLLIQNLVGNACKYSERESIQVQISAALKNGATLIYVTDNGWGIPAEEHERVFEEFYRVRRPHSEISGSGLGLALCRKIMMLHRGTLRIVRSDATGTTFELTFPGSDLT